MGLRGNSAEIGGERLKAFRCWIRSALPLSQARQVLEQDEVIPISGF